MGDDGNSTYSIDHALKDIKEAWREGRRIVPLIGAGISVDSGMPVIQGVERYLALLHLYISRGAYLNLPLGQKSSGSKHHVHAFRLIKEWYSREPDDFVRDFQWPDRFNLQQDLGLSTIWDELRREGKESNTVDHLVNESFRELLLPIVGWKASLLAHDVPNDGEKLHDLFGNWRAFIERFTEFDSDLADALIQRLHENRRPGLSHQYLAFLARINLWQRILTFNFDPLMERALTDQQMQFRVFAMEQGETFPHHELLGHRLALIKMHGDTHRLLMDQRLDRPLSREYLRRVENCLRGSGYNDGQPPLMLVLGCGGTEERCLSIVRHVSEKWSETTGNTSPATLWVHYEVDPPSALMTCLEPEQRQKLLKRPSDAQKNLLKEELKNRGIQTVRARNPGFFLMHLYSYLTSRYPASQVQYLAHIDRPVGLETQPAANQEQLQTAPVKVFDGRELQTRGAKDQWLGDTASQRLAEYVNQLPPDIQPLWIDLEDCYSVVDVVGRIVEQARRFDTTQAPGVFPLDVPHDAQSLWKLQRTQPLDYSKAIARVRRLLRRGSYCIAFDALEAFGWGPTVHHGDRHYESGPAGSGTGRDDLHEFQTRLRTELMVFLIGLCSPVEELCWDESDLGHDESDLNGTIDTLIKKKEVKERLLKETSPEDYDLAVRHRGSLIAIAINMPQRRYHDEPDDIAQSWNDAIEQFRGALADTPRADWQLMLVEYTAPEFQFQIGPSQSKFHPLPSFVHPKEQDWSVPAHDDSHASTHGESNINPERNQITDAARDRLRLILMRLATCRRTRQLVGLRRLLRPALGPVSAHVSPLSGSSGVAAGTGLLYTELPVDRLLSELADNASRLLLRVDGGGFWMSRTIRDEWYRRATIDMSPAWLTLKLGLPDSATSLPPESIAAGSPATDTESLPPVSARAEQRMDQRRIAVELWYVFAEHDRWADWYYLQNHHHSADPHSFFEYVYHRVSSIRALTVLVAWAIRYEAETQDAITQFMLRVEELMKYGSGDQWYLADVHALVQDWKRKSSGDAAGIHNKALADRINELRIVRIQWLGAVWLRAGDELEVTTGAERIILWIRWLIAVDLPQMLAPASEKMDEALKTCQAAWWRPFHDSASQHIQSLFQRWIELWQKLAFHRMDYGTAKSLAVRLIELYNKHDKSARMPFKMLWPETPGSQQKQQSVEKQVSACWTFLRALGCQALFSAHDIDKQIKNNAQPSLTQTETIDRVCRELGLWEEHLEQRYQDRKNPDLSLNLRVWRLQIALDGYDCLNVAPSVLATLFHQISAETSGKIKYRDAVRVGHDVCGEIQDDLHKWLSAQRFTDADSLIHLVWLQILQARLFVMNAGDIAISRQTSTSVSKNADFEQAYAALEAARSYAMNLLPHRQALVELYATQICLAHVELALASDDRVLGTGEQKLQAAWASLTRAFEHLRRGRRNTRWWRLYYNLRTQHAVWRLWQYCCSPLILDQSHEGVPGGLIRDKMIRRNTQREIVRVLRFIRSGLSAIRHRSNLQAEGLLTIQQLKSRAPYPYQLWRALMTIGRWAILRLKQELEKQADSSEDSLFAREVAQMYVSQCVDMTMKLGYVCSEEEILSQHQQLSQNYDRNLSLVDFLDDDLRPHLCMLYRHRIAGGKPALGEHPENSDPPGDSSIPVSKPKKTRGGTRRRTNPPAV